MCFKVRWDNSEYESKRIGCRQASLTVSTARGNSSNSLSMQQRVEFVRLKTVTITIQRCFRSFLIMKRQRTKPSWRKKRLPSRFNVSEEDFAMRLQKTSYELTTERIVRIQRRCRSVRMMRIERLKFQQMRISAVCIQTSFRSYLTMKKQCVEFLRVKSTVTVIQRRIRATCAARKERNVFLA